MQIPSLSSCCVSGEGVDIGAYEYRVGELTVDVSVDVKAAPYAAGMAFVLTPTLDGVQGTVSLDWTIVARGSGAWMTATWGCYVSNYAGKIPDGPGDGLWLSFNPMANLIRVYHPDAPSWPAAWGEIPVETGMLGGMIHTDIVCCDDKSTYIYLTAEGSADRVLAGMIRFEDGKIRIYNGEGTMLKEDTCSTNALQGENFSLFTHAGGGAMIDKLDLLAASKGEVRENVTVTAVPAEGQTLGLDITDKTDLVSINYSVWFDAILGAGSDKVTKYNDITEILAGRQEWGGSPSFHYWAKPGCGYYYRSSDKDVIRTHMTQLYEAGVDFIVIDLTNAGDGYVAGDRKAWVVGTTPLGGILLVGDMSMVENDGFVPRTGLEIGSRVVLEAPDGYDQCQLQHFRDGQWVTDETISGTTVTYEHDGQFTRAVWSVDGARLTTKVTAYGGAVAASSLTKAKAENPNRRIRINGDIYAPFRAVVQVLDVCQQEGLNVVGIHTADGIKAPNK